MFHGIINFLQQFALEKQRQRRELFHRCRCSNHSDDLQHLRGIRQRFSRAKTIHSKQDVVQHNDLGRQKKHQKTIFHLSDSFKIRQVGYDLALNIDISRSNIYVKTIQYAHI